MYVGVYVCLCVCMYVCMCVCLCVCMYVCFVSKCTMFVGLYVCALWLQNRWQRVTIATWGWLSWKDYRKQYRCDRRFGEIRDYVFPSQMLHSASHMSSIHVHYRCKKCFELMLGGDWIPPSAYTRYPSYGIHREWYSKSGNSLYILNPLYQRLSIFVQGRYKLEYLNFEVLDYAACVHTCVYTCVCINFNAFSMHVCL